MKLINYNDIEDIIDMCDRVFLLVYYKNKVEPDYLFYSIINIHLSEVTVLRRLTIAQYFTKSHIITHSFPFHVLNNNMIFFQLTEEEYLEHIVKEQI